MLLEVSQLAALLLLPQRLLDVVEQMRLGNRIGLTDGAEILGAAPGRNPTENEYRSDERQTTRLGSFAYGAANGEQEAVDAHHRAVLENHRRLADDLIATYQSIDAIA